jgi:hypothetical protein
VRSVGGALVARAIGAFVTSLALCAAVSDAAVLVNKAFSPTSVSLGQVSTVTVTLQNTSTLAGALILGFSDDIATMGDLRRWPPIYHGHGRLDG